ncbi:MAG: flagellar hook-length control protein FliK [Campylobacter sp.]
MQTTQNNILSFDASIKGGVKKQDPQKQTGKNDGENSEFLSMVLNATAKKNGEITENDIKDIANAVNMSAQEIKSNEPAKTVDVKEILGSDAAEGLYENATFMQLLQILEMLNGGEKISKYPNFSSKLAKALSNETTLNELRGAKNITELIQIANKLNLGLENISVTKEDVEELNLKFPTLAKQDFFKPVTEQNIITNNEFKTKVEENLQNTQKSKPAVALNKLLQEVAKPTQNQNLIQNEEAVEDITSEVVEQIKTDTKPVKISSEDKIKNEVKDEKKINLQSLLYPEREQNLSQDTQDSQDSQSESQNNEQNKENPLNLIVKDVISNAKSQVKNHEMIRQTFDNFNSTLKEQVEAYKSPFVRFNITLNPLNLGEVEITMVNRGNNLHINFNSNTQTMNLFLQNQAEFKNSLVNMGFTELEMNFQDQGQNRKDQGQKAYKNNNKRDELDNILSEISPATSSMEIVLPRYI